MPNERRRTKWRSMRARRPPMRWRLVASCRALRLPVTLAAIAAVTAVAGCANAPSGGPPRRATGTGSQVQAYVQPLPPPPPTGSWSPIEVVQGFVHASASYAFDPAAAEQYLVPRLRKSWRPANGPVAVVGAPNLGHSPPYNKPQQEGTGPGTQFERVTLKGQRLATLTQTGQYEGTAAGNVDYQFNLAKTDGVWLIDGLPGQSGLLLTQSDFESVYQARNLFFYAPAPWQGPLGVLEPDPVYAPLESSNSALNTNLATGLVKGLIEGPGHWLSGATSSAFPKGTRLLKQVTITDQVAHVDLGGAAVHAGSAQTQIMEAQLRATLGDQSYSAPLARRVQLYFNNTPQVQYTGAVVTAPASGPVLVVTSPSSVGQLPADPRTGSTPDVRVSPAQIGQARITAVAAEPTGGRRPQVAVAVQDQTGCAVFLTASGQTSYHLYALSTSGGPCTSLSWDNGGNLWAAAGRSVWVLRPQNRQPVPVDVAPTGIKPGNQILALRMAPDSVRAALLVQTRTGNKLVLVAARFGHDIVGFGPPASVGSLPDGADPIAISWLDAFHLAALADSGGIFSVPLTGGAGLQPGGLPQEFGPAPGGAQTLTTDGSELVVGALYNGASHIFASSLAFQGWARVTTGSDPVYPG